MKIKNLLKSKFILWSLSSFLFMASIWMISLGYISSRDGKRYIQDLLNNHLSNAVGYQVEVEDVGFNFPLSANIAKISLSDSNGKWIEIKNFSFEVSLISIFSNHFIIQDLAAKQIELIRIPNNLSTEESNKNIKVSILEIDITTILIPAAVIKSDQDIMFSFGGMLEWTSLNNELIFKNKIQISDITKSLKSLEIDVSGKYEIKAELLNFDFVQILNKTAQIQGKSKLNLASGDLDIGANLKDLAIGDWIENVSGRTNFEVKINGSIKEPIVNVMGSSYDVFYKDKNIPDLIVSINGILNKEKWIGNLKVKSEKSKDLANFNLSYIKLGQNLELNNISANYLENDIRGKIQIDLDTMLAKGNLDAKVSSVEQFSNYLPEEVKGSGSISMTLSKKNKAQSINAKIKLGNFITRDASLLKADIDIDMPDIKVVSLASVKANFSKIKYDDLIIDNAKIYALPKYKNWELDVQAVGVNNSQDFDVIGKASLFIDALANNDIELIFTLVKGSYNGAKFINKDKITVISSNLNQSLLVPKMAFENGEISLNAKITGDKIIDLLFIGKRIPIKTFKKDIPKSFENAQLEFDVDIIGSLKGPELNSSISFYIPESNKAMQKINNMTLKIKEGQAIISIKSKKKALSYYNLDANIPVDFSFSPSAIVAIKESFPLDIRLNYNLDSSILSNLLLSPDHSVNGSILGDLVVRGTYLNPLVNGAIKFEKDCYAYLPMGLKFNNISGSITAKNNLVNINNISAEDSKKNKLVIKGKADFRDIKNYVYNLQLNTNKFNLMNHPIINSIISGEMFIKGNNKSGKIKGNINNETLSVYLPDRFAKSIPTLNITEVIPNPDQAKQRPLLAYPIFLDVILQAKNKAFVRGWGVDAELSGKLMIKGEANKPQIMGKLSVIRGSYEEFGKKFKLKTAELSFEGKIPPSPYLNIIGSSTKSGIEIMPIITGPLLNPSLSIESYPVKTQEEIMSILLFGNDPSKISAFQAIELANSLKKLSTNSGSSFDPLGTIRDKLGLDEISFNNSDSSSKTPAIGVSKYISDSIRIKVNQDKEYKGAKLGIEADITPNISLESGGGVNGSNSLGINWKRDY